MEAQNLYGYGIGVSRIPIQDVAPNMGLLQTFIPLKLQI